MKSLILKDLYNIGSNAKSMLVILTVFAVSFIPNSGPGGYVFMSTLMCSTMVVTTFSFDERACWSRYAMVMPVSRKELVAGKFVVLLIFSVIGAAVGLVVGTAGGAAVGRFAFSGEEISELMFSALAAVAVGMVFGSMMIPLAFKFGAEKGRILILVSFMVPAAVCYGAYRLLGMAGVQMTDRFELVLLCCAPAAAAGWCFGMYKISCAIFSRQEF